MKKYLAILGLLLVAMIWGGGFVASNVALESLSPFQIMAIRFFLGTMILGGISTPVMKNIKKEEVIAGLCMGCVLFAGFAFQIVGLQDTTPSKNAFLTATNVVMVPFITFLVCRKTVGISAIAGAVMAIAGVGILSVNGNLSLGAGDALTLMGAVGFAMQIFLTGIFASRHRVMALNMVQMAVAFLLSVIFLLFRKEASVHGATAGLLSVTYLGVVSTALTYFLQTNCQRHVEETKAAIILSMESVFGALFSVILLHEHVTPRMIGGCVLILAAVLFSNFPSRKREGRNRGKAVKMEEEL